MKIAYLGNYSAPWCTEQHVALSLEALGHEVTRLQEGEVRAAEVPAAADGHDLLFWTQTFGLAAAGGTIEERFAMLDELRARNIPSVGIHLDRWWGLSREDQIHTEPFFRVDHLFTADGGHDEEWAAAGINHTWMPPGVFAGEAVLGQRTPRYRAPIVFVGNHARYHHEWEHRVALIGHLRRRWRHRLALWPRGQQIRGAELSNLYASAAIVVGDSCLAGGATRYFSDRIPETLGRGGFLLHPYVDGIEHLYTDGKHLRFFPVGDFDELDRLIAYYLTHDDERRSIASAGREHVLEHHTYATRMGEVLEAIPSRRWRGEVRAGSPDELIVGEIYEQDVYRARPHILPGSLVVDVGANVGVFSIWAAQQGANVIAVEPVAANLDQFTRNASVHGLGPRISVLPRAAGGRDGWARTMPREVAPANSGEAWTEPCKRTDEGAVRVLSLNSLLADLDDVAVLKLDIEGAEYETIEGASLESLRRVNFITIEFHGGPMTQRTVAPGSFGAMVEKLAEVFSLEIIGLPSNGGYIYGRRHSD